MGRADDLGMTKTTPPHYRSDTFGDDVALADCEALLVCLNNGRFVVVRPAEPRDLWPVSGGWEKVRELAAGDEVIYKGGKAVVRAIEVYR